MTIEIFLHGGGDRAEARQETFGRFVNACLKTPADKLALIVAEVDEAAAQESWQAYRAIFTSLDVPLARLHPLFASAANPLTYEAVAAAAPSGLFVCGGVTPFYHQALCGDPAWTAYLDEANVPFGGTSAGAAVAAQTAVLGGWQAERQGQSREILFVGAGEGVDALLVQPGLGLVPFAVDVHASQMGTLTRLIHAVELGLVAEGWAIDENTMVVVNGRHHSIYGLGHVYHVWREANEGVGVRILTASTGV